jgi:hypothetical protein
MDFNEFLKLKPDHWFIGLLMAMATFAPGSLVVFLYERDLFITLDFGKIVLLSLATTLPLVFINLILSFPHALNNSSLDLNRANSEALDTKQQVMSSCLLTAVSLYASLMISYFLKFNFTNFLISVVSVNIVFAIILWVPLFYSARRSKRY